MVTFKFMRICVTVKFKRHVHAAVNICVNVMFDETLETYKFDETLVTYKFDEAHLIVFVNVWLGTCVDVKSLRYLNSV